MARKNGKKIKLDHVSSSCLLLLLSRQIKERVKNKTILERLDFKGRFGELRKFIPDITETDVKSIFNYENIFWSPNEYIIEINEYTLQQILSFISQNITLEDTKEITKDIFERIALENLLIEAFQKELGSNIDQGIKNGFFQLFKKIKEICSPENKIIPFFLHFLSILIKKDIDLFLNRDKKNTIILPISHFDFIEVFKCLFDFFNKGCVIGTSVPFFTQRIWKAQIGDEVLAKNKAFIDNGGKFSRFFIKNFNLNKKRFAMENSEVEIFKKQLDSGIHVFCLLPLIDIDIKDYDFSLFCNPSICVNKMSFISESNKKVTSIESNIHFGDKEFFTKTKNKLVDLLEESCSELYKIEMVSNRIKHTLIRGIELMQIKKEVRDFGTY